MVGDRRLSQVLYAGELTFGEIQMREAAVWTRVFPMSLESDDDPVGRVFLPSCAVHLESISGAE